MEVRRNIWNSFVGRYFLILLLSIILLTGSFYTASAAPRFQSPEGQGIFEKACASCHSIGAGTIVGPDLEGVLDRRERAWVMDFISMPDVILASDDPIAAELLVEFNGIPMPNLGLTETEVEALLFFLEGGESVAPAALSLPEGNFDRGKAIFAGGQTLANNGTPCIACHTVGSVGLLAGGELGPDLTKVYTRYGEAGLASSITNIAFPTMQGVYAEKSLTDQEVADLLAYFSAVDAEGEEDTAKKAAPLFWLFGIGGAGALFGIMSFFWSGQRETLSDRLRKNAGVTSRRHS